MAALTLRKKYALLLEASNIMCDKLTALLQQRISMFEKRPDVCKQLKKLFWTLKFINSDMIDDFKSRVVKMLIIISSNLNKADAEHLNIVSESARKIVATFIEIKNVEDHYTRLKSPR